MLAGDDNTISETTMHTKHLGGRTDDTREDLPQYTNEFIVHQLAALQTWFL